MKVHNISVLEVGRSFLYNSVLIIRGKDLNKMLNMSGPGVESMYPEFTEKLAWNGAEQELRQEKFQGKMRELGRMNEMKTVRKVMIVRKA
jgi:hypothetical protein